MARVPPTVVLVQLLAVVTLALTERTTLKLVCRRACGKPEIILTLNQTVGLHGAVIELL